MDLVKLNKLIFVMGGIMSEVGIMLEREMTIEKFEKYYDFTIKCIDREDNLIHYRLTWMLQSNAALLFIFLVPIDRLQIDQNTSIMIVSFIGILFTSLSFFAIFSARKQLRYLTSGIEAAAEKLDKTEFINSCDISKRNYHKKNFDNKVHYHSGYPRPFGERGRMSIAKGGIGAPYIYSFIIILLWSIVFIRSI